MDIFCLNFFVVLINVLLERIKTDKVVDCNLCLYKMALCFPL